MGVHTADRRRPITYDRAMPRSTIRNEREGRAPWGCLALLLLGSVSPALSAGEPQGRCPGKSMDQAIASAERKHRARVVKASVDQGDERCVYVLRLLSEDGRVWTVRVDSRSGD